MRARTPKPDWKRVAYLAEALARRVPPITESDRRQWFRFAAMADTSFSEHWLFDAAESVINASTHRRSPQAHLVGILKAKALAEGIDHDAFLAIIRGIWVPADVWESDFVPLRKRYS